MYQDNNNLRISISSECLITGKQDVLNQAYENLKELFVTKYISTSILNGDELSDYLIMLSEHNIDDKQSKDNIQEDKEKSESTKKSQIKWNF